MSEELQDSLFNNTSRIIYGGVQIKITAWIILSEENLNYKKDVVRHLLELVYILTTCFSDRQFNITFFALCRSSSDCFASSGPLKILDTFSYSPHPSWQEWLSNWKASVDCCFCCQHIRTTQTYDDAVGVRCLLT